MRPHPSLRTLAAGVLLAVALTGCSSEEDPQEATPAGPVASSATGSATERVLAERGLDGLAPAELIDRLDRLAGADRPRELMASVRPDELVLAADGQETALPIEGDRFYLSVAPYVDRTHECFHHSLTTCTGELAGVDVTVTITDETHDEVLVDRTVTTFANGFVGFWLPRDIEGTVEVTHDGKTGAVDIATGADDPTCLTTLQLT